MPMLETHPAGITLDRAKPAGAIDALIACRACEVACRDLLATIG